MALLFSAVRATANDQEVEFFVGGIANIRACNQADEPSEYEHKDLVSKISQDECFICGFKIKDTKI